MLTEDSLALVNRMLETRLKAFQAGDPAALTQVHEVQVLRKEDAPVWTEMATTLLVDERGRIGVIGVSRDISERKRAQETLRESEARLRTFYEAAFNGIVISEHGTIVDLNSRVAELLGYEIAELLGRKVVDLVAPDDRPLVQKHQDEGYELPYENHLVRKDGTVIAVETQARHCIYSGRPMRVTAMRDITARLKMEQQLNQLLQQQKVILDAAPIGISLIKNRIIQWDNAAHSAMFGYAPEEMRGMDTAALYVHAEDYERVGREASLKIAQGLHYAAEVELHRRNGARFWCLLQGRATDPKDLSAGIIWMVMDVAERKEAESKLLKMSRALEQSPVTILITDLAGRMEYVNEAFTKLTGYSREEALGKNPRILKSGKTPPEEYKRLWNTVLAGRDWRGELLNRTKEGKLFWESAVISPITDPNGQITHLLAVKEDITHRKQLQEQLRQAQKMEAIGQLAGGVAHDFNNILAATLMHLGLLLENPHLTMGTKDSLKEIEKETLRAANLTRQLLLFGQRHAARAEPLNLNELIDDLLKMLRRLLGEHIGITTLFSSKSAWVKADAGMLEQVVVNLCINARDAMPKGGSLTLATTLLELEAEPARPHPDARPGRFVCLSVTDTGCGMTQSVLGRIFEPFFTTKDVGKGTGLGLASVYGIVKQHEGWVEVESEVGCGSCFRVFLPAGAGPLNNPAVPGSAEVIIGGTETILLVEDEPPLRQMVALCLRKLGYQVLESANGPEALRVWEQHHQKIQLLLTDMVMPEKMTGLELAEQLKKKKDSLQVIISSGYGADMLKSPLIAALKITCLPKPYAAPALAKIVRRCLDGT